ncbi:hypothetical protein CVS40_7094 [Lucilia cuprina]|nr:hypothetical protein CVS40_7094 [Lucilia cuprina]
MMEDDYTGSNISRQQLTAAFAKKKLKKRKRLNMICQYLEQSNNNTFFYYYVQLFVIFTKNHSLELHSLTLKPQELSKF